MKNLVKSLIVGVGLACAGVAMAAEVSVAVAANFTAPMQKIAQMFEQDTGHKAVLSFGSTGNLYAQIKNGAPFQILLAADDETPARIEKENLGVANSRFTYATGKLVLWSARVGRVDNQGLVLQAADLGKVALASPKVAPYGAAAVEAMGQLGLTTALAPRLVQGESIGQAFAFAATGNADVGFVALSQVLEGGKLKSGSVWVVPQHLYSPIRQDAVVLKKAATNAAAQALVTLLQSPNVKDLIRSHGYAP